MDMSMTFMKNEREACERLKNQRKRAGHSTCSPQLPIWQRPLYSDSWQTTKPEPKNYRYKKKPGKTVERYTLMDDTLNSTGKFVTDH